MLGTYVSQPLMLLGKFWELQMLNRFSVTSLVIKQASFTNYKSASHFIRHETVRLWKLFLHKFVSYNLSLVVLLIFILFELR